MEAEPTAKPTEPERVFKWVRGCFVVDGFTLRQARVLADRHADHHEAEALLAAGCPVELVFDILS